MTDIDVTYDPGNGIIYIGYGFVFLWGENAEDVIMALLHKYCD